MSNRLRRTKPVEVQKESTTGRGALYLHAGLPALVAAAVMGLFLWACARIFFYRIGFPLDDAWIHQTYARNLALRGEWAFLPGVRSAGSTAPLWTFLLAIGYKFFTQPYAWAFLLGFGGLLGTALLGEGLFRAEMPLWKSRIPWIALFLAGEWHLVWAAVSGMETTLYAAMILAVFWLLRRQTKAFWAAGALAGLAVWVRPDGVTLIGPVLFVIVLSAPTWRARTLRILPALAAFSVGVGLYLLFNRLSAASWLPNTFYAKQAEYAIYQQFPLWQRFFSLAGLPLVGTGVLLLPGAVFSVWHAYRDRRWVLLSMAIWWLGYTLLYAVRLPVTYQHGRYLMPAMPVFFVLGAVGTARLLSGARLNGRLGFVLKRVWALSAAAAWIVFVGIGARGYAEDVAIIETEMVSAAHWINKNTPADALIAVHDIGAIGYYSQRNLIDLAGLVSPEVIPFIRDEDQLAEYMDARGVDYLVTFPSWYSEMVKRAEPVFEAGGYFPPASGEENIVVYRWSRRPSP